MMANLSARCYAGESDLTAIADLINTCEAVDRLDQGTSISELQQEFNQPSRDLARDICLWEDAGGKLIGFAELWISEPGTVIDGWLSFSVRPEARCGDVEAAAVAWGERRMREVASLRGAQVKLRSGVRTQDADRISVLTNCGFRVDRYFCRMARSLTEPIAQAQFPEGFALRLFPGEQDSEAWVEMFNQSFIDHWNHHDLTVEKFKYDLAKPSYRKDLDLIAVAADGTFAAFCYCEINVEECDRTGRNEGWIAVLGTRRGFRKLGLGRAMLLAGLQRLKAAGVETAILGVDTANPSGALRLYESAGFHNIRDSISYIKDV
ncbi:MAG: GNAT family N-acetyltransferase [Microcoleus sp. PH2017_15_JOR_U_A]|uniref:GNAT family N-acetyltransferase n=1 Tax=Microcoleus sp. PH2017_15_JOR_U_A TaxID=2798826 RepID=UPI001D4757A5|nr:GNAT family N-acetyltransferase [Microcoleus sp. PH2017_15_JOR_U_A]MCC3498808.1 GNAT family N-acetyltransferase [Microcoleus sp. PH2017_15_JOR_U_A]